MKITTKEIKNSIKILFIPYCLLFIPAEAAMYDNTEASTISDTIPKSNTYFNTKNPSTKLDYTPSYSTKKTEMTQAFRFIVNKQLPEAKKLINKIITNSPTSPHGYILNAMLGLAEGKDQQVKDNFSKALTLNKKNITALHGLADLAVKQGDLEQAKKYHQTILEINDKYAKSYFALAHIALKQNKIQKVEALLIKAYDLAKGNLPFQLSISTDLAKHYIKQKKLNKLSKLSDELVKQYPENNAALLFKVNSFIINKDITSAENLLKKLIKSEPNRSEYKIRLANILSKLDSRKIEIIPLLDKIITENPNKIQSYAFKTHHLINLKQFSDAHSTANKTDKLFPKSSIGKQLQAKIYLAEEKNETAIELYSQAFQQDSNKKTLITLVSLLKQQGKEKEALDIIEKEIKTMPNALGLKMLAALMSDAKKAEQYYLQIIQQRNNYVPALNNLAWLYHKTSNIKAIDLAKKAYQLAPESASIADTFGVILTAQGEINSGITILEKALALNPQMTEIKLHLARAYFLKNNRKKAVKILDKINLKSLSESEKTLFKTVLSAKK